MQSSQDEMRRLLKESLYILFVTIAGVTGAYFYVDIPTAWFFYDLQWNKYEIFKIFTDLPIGVVSVAFIGLPFVCVWLAFRPWSRCVYFLLVMTVTLATVDASKRMLKDVFGRFWPATWIDSNPSLLHDGAYGFHWFHTGPAYGSFPSGHTMLACTVSVLLCHYYPRGYIAYWMFPILVVAGLLVNNFHFVGDIIAGVGLGIIYGRYAATLSLAKPFYPNSGINDIIKN